MIPKEIRERLGLKEGDRLIIYPLKDGIMIRKERGAKFRDLRGILSGKVKLEELARELRTLREEWALDQVRG